MKQEELLRQARQLFSDYRQQHHQRKTTEKFVILDEIYLRNDHFDAESLYTEMKQKNFNISRATVYNTLELLKECRLISKHQLGKNHARFEKSYGFRQHDHLVCLDCSKVIEFCDPRVHQITTRMGEIFHFDIPHHSLILYGHCQGCEVKAEKDKTALASMQGKIGRKASHTDFKNILRNAI
jgi:Fur family ferric uptake transcriptional regulator